MAEHKNQDVDLLDVFKWLKQLWVNLWINIYRFFLFLIRNALIVVVLLVLGFGIGYGLSSLLKSKYKAELIIKPNLNTTSYLYQKTEELDSRLVFKNSDGSLTAIDAIEIEPVKDITDLLENLSEIPTAIIPDVTDYRETESEFYKKTLFTPGYAFHRIEIVAKDTTDPRDLLRSMEASTFLQQKLQAARLSLNTQITENQFSINQIDSLLLNLNNQLKQNQSSSATTPVISVLQGSDITQLYASVLENKTELLELQDELTQKRLDLQEVFKIYSVSSWKSKASLKTYLPILLPLFFVFCFLLLKFLKRLRGRLQELSNSSVH
ncbi:MULTISPECIES: hypothetical protein [unclassified Leeuwenhoekiella]|uniref:hypothetical protein n=1 Tax=unclassified Leeuwenhoekiella TaxID=2615029 RepID=UPI000C4F3A62|nr:MULTISPECIES: hypothetical protein [unclassified Leeuwenhoekiella]MAW96007.1 hypothetical protein [Leeuwenhoekiella sp.]MBA80001.1 hypothetical protein [Leeuwenhoekiella sp.]|tara:strand:+ start:2437 stop:3405 length:969 start_codon:yes stop_codon:yes gene_type:complete